LAEKAETIPIYDTAAAATTMNPNPSFFYHFSNQTHKITIKLHEHIKTNLQQQKPQHQISTTGKLSMQTTANRPHCPSQLVFCSV